MRAFVVSFARHGENTTDRSKRYRREINEKFRLKAISDDNHAVSSRQALGSLLFSGDAATVLDAPTLQVHSRLTPSQTVNAQERQQQRL